MRNYLPGTLASMMMLLLSACSGLRDVSERHYEYENAHSLAWNISTAAGMTSFEDAKLNPPLSTLYSRKDYDLSYPVKSAQTLNESTLSLAPLLRFTPTGMAPEDWWFNRILAWIPTELAKTPQQASTVLANTIQEAVLTTLKETKRPIGEIKNEAGDNDWLDKYALQITVPHYVVIHFADSAAGCEFPDKNVPFIERIKLPSCAFFAEFHDPEKVVSTPAFITPNATGKSYLIRPDGLNSSFVADAFDKPSTLSDDDRTRMAYDFLQKVSQHLPSWVIFYISPHERAGMPAMVLQSGKVYFFVTERLSKP